jgi:type IV pilus assembly protein PilM
MPVIGLDLGKHTFRAVEIEKSRDKYTLLKFGTYENKKIDLDSESKDDMSHYSEAIKQFFAESGFSSREVVVSLPEKDIFMRVINVPKMSDKDLRNSIQYEAEQYIPLPFKEVNLSYQKRSSNSSKQRPICGG